ncbi:hypothetical protein PsYK624_012730 [Phanerochaete sordida]|uniref:Uncharacterized protein n=1 Tax=Phanerochaete sordida TaxID=48140 RepID=A0A9P3L7P3_9APHY|nr:hypothetical protein PsYK624_012730 [Phanerochaete sordida]
MFKVDTAVHNGTAAVNNHSAAGLPEASISFHRRACIDACSFPRRQYHIHPCAVHNLPFPTTGHPPSSAVFPLKRTYEVVCTSIIDSVQIPSAASIAPNVHPSPDHTQTAYPDKLRVVLTYRDCLLWTASTRKQGTSPADAP